MHVATTGTAVDLQVGSNNMYMKTRRLNSFASPIALVLLCEQIVFHIKRFPSIPTTASVLCLLAMLTFAASHGCWSRS